jgi:mRNA interferase RelE/StbE
VNWDYEFSETARRNLRDAGPSVAKEITDYLDKRVKGGADPRAFGRQLRGALREYWRYRVKDYRIICHLQDARLIVLVVHVAHRSTVYD